MNQISDTSCADVSYYQNQLHGTNLKTLDTMQVTVTKHAKERLAHQEKTCVTTSNVGVYPKPGITGCACECNMSALSKSNI